MLMNYETDLQNQLEFVREVDRLKQVIRRNYLMDGSRAENTAEHSWHAALTAFILQEHANQPVDICRVGKMLLIHDVIEVEAGDTYIYDPTATADQEERELAAAHNLFGMLPEGQGSDLLACWLEFEARQTAEARFAKAIDRFMPMFANYESGGKSWLEHGISKARMLEINHIIADGSETLWQEAQRMIGDAAERGLLS
jgi:putative hydrolase of HD superfamily